MSTARSASGVSCSGISNRRSPSLIALEGYVPVLARGYRLAFGRKHPQCVDQPRPRLGRFDHVVDEPTLRCRVRRGELVAVLADQLLALGGRIGRLLDL